MFCQVEYYISSNIKKLSGFKLGFELRLVTFVKSLVIALPLESKMASTYFL